MTKTIRIPMLASNDDGRGIQRRKVLKPGVIIIARKSTINCTVRNISPSGAKLEVPTVVGIPDVFELDVDGQVRACRVVWRRLKELGIAFIAPARVRSPSSRR